MYHEFLDRAPIPEIEALRPKARDSIVLCDVGGLVKKLRLIEASGSLPHYARTQRGRVDDLERGDASLGAKADEYIRKLEEEQFLSRAWAQCSDVVGSLPNVPAFLSGHPQSMRRRVRLKKPQGPLALFLECTGSGGAEWSAAIRGSAMLALVRILESQRPIDVYVCVTYGEYNTMNAVVCRVETRPLDLARAAYSLVNLNTMAALGRAIIADFRPDRNPGSWSYGTPDLERRYCGEIFRRVLTPDAEILYVPAAFARDSGLGSAYDWLRRMLKKYGGDAVVREDDEVDPDTGFREY